MEKVGRFLAKNEVGKEYTDVSSHDFSTLKYQVQKC